MPSTLIGKAIVFNSNTDYNLYLFRFGLMKEMQKKGWTVYALCPSGEYVDDIIASGFVHLPITIDRKGLNPFRDLIYCIQLAGIFLKIKPTVVHSFTIKPNIYSNIAGFIARVPIQVNSVTGLGYIFIGNSFLKIILRNIAITMYRCAFLFSNTVIFQNKDDYSLFTKTYRIVSPLKAVVIQGSGVDTAFFSPDTVDLKRLVDLRERFQISQGQIVISMIGRMLWDKGVSEFVEAAKLIKATHPDAFFLMVGRCDEGNPMAVPEKYLLKNSPHITWIGHQRDIKHILALSSIVVLPSYREGLPKILLEAMAMAKPIITTNAEGCRDAIEHEKNGVQVEVRDVENLMHAIKSLVVSEEKRILYGARGRQIVCKKFGEDMVIAEHFVYYHV